MPMLRITCNEAISADVLKELSAVVAEIAGILPGSRAMAAESDGTRLGLARRRQAAQ